MHTYEYLGVKWGVEYAEHTKEMMDPLLGDYFKLSEINNQELAFTVKLLSDEYKNIREVIEYGTRTVIHNSKKPSVHEEGLMFSNGYTTQTYNISTRSVYYMNYISKKIVIYNKDIAMLAKDGIRVIRDIVKTNTETANNAVMYHAAALKSGDGKGIILIGGKGSGKTTFSLKLLYEYGFTEISRDRVFVNKSEQGYCLYGWPNYYNLTMRTIKSFKAAEKHLPSKYVKFTDLQLDCLSQKVQMLPEDLDITKKEHKCDMTHVIYLINKNRKDNCDTLDMLAHNCYSPDDLNYPDWHKWISDKSNIYKNAHEITKDLYRYKNTMVLEWEDIDKGVQDIISFIK